MSSSKKILLITGSTDGLGLETAKRLILQGHTVLIHGRSKKKLAATFEELLALAQSQQQANNDGQVIESYRADLSKFEEVKAMADKIISKHDRIDVLMNNAGILKTPVTKTDSGMDIRFAVNTIAPYLLTKLLLPLIPIETGRIVNLSSAGQYPVNFKAWSDTHREYADFDAYAESKLAIIMWSNHLAATSLKKGPVITSLNPGSLLGTKMVKEGFGHSGKDVNIGVNIMCEAALGDSFQQASGKYFDNDSGRFARPRADALNPSKCAQLVEEIESILDRELSSA